MNICLYILAQAAEPNLPGVEPAEPLAESFLGPMIVTLLIVIVAVLVVMAVKRRRHSLGAFARKRGLSEVDLSDAQAARQRLEQLLGGSALYAAGYLVKIDAWYTGEIDGLTAHVIDLREYAVHGNRRETEADAYYNNEHLADQGQAFVVFQGESLAALPRFMAVPNHPLLRALGPKHDVVLFEDEQFNKTIRVNAPRDDTEATHDLLTESARRMLKQSDSLSMESADDVLVFCRYSTRLGGDEVESMLDEARQLMRAMNVK